MTLKTPLLAETDCCVPAVSSIAANRTRWRVKSPAIGGCPNQDTAADGVWLSAGRERGKRPAGALVNAVNYSAPIPLLFLSYNDCMENNRLVPEDQKDEPVIEREVYVNHDEDSFSDVTIARYPSGMVVPIRGVCRFKFEGEIIIE